MSVTKNDFQETPTVFEEKSRQIVLRSWYIVPRFCSITNGIFFILLNFLFLEDATLPVNLG